MQKRVKDRPSICLLHYDMEFWNSLGTHVTRLLAPEFQASPFLVEGAATLGYNQKLPY